MINESIRKYIGQMKMQAVYCIMNSDACMRNKRKCCGCYAAKVMHTTPHSYQTARERAQYIMVTSNEELVAEIIADLL